MAQEKDAPKLNLKQSTIAERRNLKVDLCTREAKEVKLKEENFESMTPVLDYNTGEIFNKI